MFLFKKFKTKIMKKIIITIIISLLLISCSSSSNDINQSTSQTYNWHFKLNGVLYQWSGSLFDEAGMNKYKVGSKKLNLVKGNLNMIILFPNASTGDFTFSNSGVSLYFFYTNLDWDSYNSGGGATMNVNVSSISSNSYSSNPSNPGKVVGTFSGTIKKNQGGQISTITDGYFEVVNF